MWIYLIIAAAVIAVDQLTKLWTVSGLDVHESITVIPQVFRFTYVQNEGAAMGILAGHRWVFMVISTVALAALAVYLCKNYAQSRTVSVALSLIIGGGIGNMIDRIRLGYVIDMLDFCAFDFWVWVFNVADACVCIGGGILILWCLVMTVREARDKRAKAESAQTEQQSDAETDSVQTDESENKQEEPNGGTEQRRVGQ